MERCDVMDTIDTILKSVRRNFNNSAANIVNEYLNQLAHAVYVTNYFLQYCKQPFSVTSFLQHKLKFAQPLLI